MSNLVAGHSQTLVLASSSPYRRHLLTRLGIPFIAVSPDLGEQPLESESPSELAWRLAERKAGAVRHNFPDALIIGSDQVAVLDGQVLHKPGNQEANIKQLLRASGRQVQVLTSVCVLNARTGCTQVELVSATVHFRSLSLRQIQCYVSREQPFDCVGGFKSEGLGVALFSRLEVTDPSAIVGLPLIPLVRMLANEQLDVILTSRASPISECCLK
jgi:septum formation protein